MDGGGRFQERDISGHCRTYIDSLVGKLIIWACLFLGYRGIQLSEYWRGSSSIFLNSDYESYDASL